MRRSTFASIMAVGLVAAGGAAWAQAVPPQGAPTQVATTDNPGNPIICRYEVEAGSRFTHRICLTDRQWKLKTEKARDLLDRLDSGKNQALFQ